MQYWAFVEQLELSHWLIIAGVALVLFGVVGIVVRRAGDSVHVAMVQEFLLADPGSIDAG
jgi:hypothetical protein